MALAPKNTYELLLCVTTYDYWAAPSCKWIFRFNLTSQFHAHVLIDLLDWDVSVLPALVNYFWDSSCCGRKKITMVTGTRFCSDFDFQTICPSSLRAPSEL